MVHGAKVDQFQTKTQHARERKVSNGQHPRFMPLECFYDSINLFRCCEKQLSVGEKTLKVPLCLFAENRARLCDRLRGMKDLPKNSCVFLQGGDNLPLYDTDVDYVFRQVSNFDFEAYDSLASFSCLNIVRRKKIFIYRF